MQTSRKLTNLQVWQMAMDFAVRICKEVLPALPKDEKYALVEQLRRAAQSIPANIAEGFGRHHYLDAVRFNYFARGSLLETYSHLAFAQRMGYLPPEQYTQLVAQLQDLHIRLNAYISFLKRSKQGANEIHHPGGENASGENAVGFEARGEEAGGEHVIGEYPGEYAGSETIPEDPDAPNE